MKKVSRRWYRIGNYSVILILVDYQLKSIIATLEQVCEPTESASWAPNQDQISHKFVAHAMDEIREFPFNPHNLEEFTQVATEAVSWCEMVVGPPVTVVTTMEFVFKALLFWKWKLVRRNGKIIGLADKKLPDDTCILGDGL